MIIDEGKDAARKRTGIASFDLIPSYVALADETRVQGNKPQTPSVSDLAKAKELTAPKDSAQHGEKLFVLPIQYGNLTDFPAFSRSYRMAFNHAPMDVHDILLVMRADEGWLMKTKNYDNPTIGGDKVYLGDEAILGVRKYLNRRDLFERESNLILCLDNEFYPVLNEVVAPFSAQNRIIIPSDSYLKRQGLAKS